MEHVGGLPVVLPGERSCSGISTDTNPPRGKEYLQRCVTGAPESGSCPHSSGTRSSAKLAPSGGGVSGEVGRRGRGRPRKHPRKPPGGRRGRPKTPLKKVKALLLRRPPPLGEFLEECRKTLPRGGGSGGGGGGSWW